MEVNGISLYVEKSNVLNSKATVIITHGILEHSGRYDHLISGLNKAGYAVIKYDLRGHGRSGGKKGKIKSFHNFLDDLHVIVNEEKRSGSKIALFGHSMGGLIVNLYAAKYGDVSLVISSGGATDTPKDAVILKKIGFWYLRWLPKKNRFKNGVLSSIPQVEEQYFSDPLVLKKFYVSLAGEMFIKGVKYLKKNLLKIQTPILYLHGEADRIVPVSFSSAIYEKIGVKDKELKIYQGMAHEILNEVNSAEVIKDIIDWLDVRIKAE